MQQLRSTKRTAGLACLTLLAAVILTAIGIHWVSTRGISLGAVSIDPTASRFVTSVFTRHWTSDRIEIRDLKTGEQCCDLGPWASSFSYGGNMYRWSDDGKTLGGVGYKLDRLQWAWHLTVVELDVSAPKAKLLNEWRLPSSKQVIGVAFNSSGELVHVNLDNTVDPTTGRRKVEVVRDVKVLSEFEVGKDELISPMLTLGGHGLSFHVSNQAYGTNTKPPADVIVGMPELRAVTISISPDTGQLIGKHKDNLLADRAGAEFLYRRSGADEFQVFEFDDPIHPLTEFSVSKGSFSSDPVALANEEFLCCRFDPHYTDPTNGRTYPGGLIVIDAKTNTSRDLKIPHKSWLATAHPSGQVILVDADSRFVRLDLQNEELTPLFDYQRGTAACGIATLIGVPLLWLIFWFVGSRDISPHPFLDMAFLLAVNALMGVLWCAIGLKAVIPANPATLFAASSGMAVALFGTAWVFHSDALFRFGLPSLIAAFALAVIVVLFWSGENTWHAFEETVAGAFLIGWQLFGLTMYRLGQGRLIRADEIENEIGELSPASAPSKPAAQVSMLHVLLLVGACALLFAVLRFLKLDERIIKQVFTQYAIWIVTLVGLAAGLSIAALRCNVYIRPGWLSLLAYLAIAAVACVIHFYATIKLDTSNAGWNGWVRALVVSSAGLLNWFAFLYCRRHVRLQRMVQRGL